MEINSSFRSILVIKVTPVNRSLGKRVSASYALQSDYYRRGSVWACWGSYWAHRIENYWHNFKLLKYQDDISLKNSHFFKHINARYYNVHDLYALRGFRSTLYLGCTRRMWLSSFELAVNSAAAVLCTSEKVV